MAAISSRKTSTKAQTAQKGLTAAGSGMVGASAAEWQPHDYQVRQTALDTAARVLGGTTTSSDVVLKAAQEFYAFLTGKSA